MLIVTRNVGNKCDLEVGKKGPSIRCADKEMSVVWHLCNCLFFSDQTKDDVNGTSPTTAHGDTQPIAMVDQFNRRFGGIAAKQPDSSTRRKMRRRMRGGINKNHVKTYYGRDRNLVAFDLRRGWVRQAGACKEPSPPERLPLAPRAARQARATTPCGR